MCVTECELSTNIERMACKGKFETVDARNFSPIILTPVSLCLSLIPISAYTAERRI